MFKTLRSSLYTMGLTATAAILAVLAFALWSFESLGQSALRTRDSSAVVASALPPTLYLVETRLLLSQVVEGTLPADVGRDRIAELAQQNARELGLWFEGAPPELRGQIRGELATTSREMFLMAEVVLAAVEQGDEVRTRQALKAAQAAFERHRQAVDVLVAVGRGLQQTASAGFEKTLHDGALALVATAFVFLFAAALGYFRALHSVLKPIDECVALANRVAQGDLSAPDAPLRADELGTLQDALAQMTARLSAGRTRLVDARDAAERAGRAKADFLANMSHEIRTPMNAVLGLTQVLMRSSLSPTQRDYLEKIHRSGQLLLHVINDVLDFSKIDAGSLVLEHAPFELDRVLDDVADMLDTLIGDKPIELVVRRDGAVPNRVVGDALRLKQVLLNLASNAVKFTDRGEVCLAVAWVGSGAGDVTLRFSVHDTGVGIAAAAQGQLFRPFTQADVSTTRAYGGTGLGLAISQRIVGQMGGRIEVVSAAGEGSVFSFSLTLRRAGLDTASAPVSPQRGDDPAQSLQGRVLLVEDTEINQLVAIELLGALGLEVDVADDASQALAQLAPGRFDAIIMDVQMPGMDGLEATRIIRGDGRYSALPIIAMTANSMAGEREKCLAAGMSDYLSKPIEPELLEACLARWLPRRVVRPSA